MEDEYNVQGYLPSFIQHLEDTGARLALRAGSQANEDRVDAGETVAEAGALSSWAPTERDALFRATSVYSRWRPDLIAACIPTKSEWEVWMYLEALEEGVAALVTQQSDEDVVMHVNGSSSDSRSHSGSDMDEVGGVCEPALEVSQAWINVEEHMAALIAGEEQHASLEDDGITDTEDVEAERGDPLRRKRGRPRGSEKGRAQGRVRRHTVSSRGSHSPPRVRPSSLFGLTASSTPKREAMMAHLEVPHLLVLDNILRESEETIIVKNNNGEGLVTVATPIEPEEGGVPRGHDVQGSSQSSCVSTLQGQFPSDVVIDPVLLALSGGASPMANQSSSISTSSPCVTSAHDLAQVASSLPSVTSRPASLSLDAPEGNVFGFSFVNARFTDSDPTTNVEADPSLLSPRSRRRLQKRLYMRRKRALAKGSGDVMDKGLERLKPGKKRKAGRSKTPAVSTSVQRSGTPEDVEMSGNMSKKCRGLTLPYKLKAQFAELGVDAAYLRAQGMDLLNMNALGKLMGLWSALEQGEEETDEVESIDGELLRHLQAAVVLFVTDVMHRAIVWRERDVRLKQRSQAWRLGDQITVHAVEHAVEAIGVRYRSHKEYFKTLEASYRRFVEPSPTPANTPETPNLTLEYADLDVEATDQCAPELPSFSVHRDVCAPVLCPPLSWRIDPLSCLSRTYEQEATRTRHGKSVENEEGELMPDETDEEALAAEMAEEDEADVRDMEQASAHEHDLWQAVRLDIT